MKSTKLPEAARAFGVKLPPNGITERFRREANPFKSYSETE